MPKSNKYQLEKRRETVSQMYLKGLPQYQIAQEVGVSVSQVSHDLIACRKMWHKSILQNTGELKAQEIAKIDRVEAEASLGWERSLKPVKRQRQEMEGDKVTKTIRDQMEAIGNPRFLDVIIKCIDTRCRLLGLTESDITINNININPKEWVK